MLGELEITFYIKYNREQLLVALKDENYFDGQYSIGLKLFL